MPFETYLPECTPDERLGENRKWYHTSFQHDENENA